MKHHGERNILKAEALGAFFFLSFVHPGKTEAQRGAVSVLPCLRALRNRSLKLSLQPLPQGSVQCPGLFLLLVRSLYPPAPHPQLGLSGLDLRFPSLPPLEDSVPSMQGVMKAGL